MRFATLALLLQGLISLSQQQVRRIPMVDRTTPLIPMSQYVPPGDLDGNPQLYYPTNYRILDCWECFEAQGKLCIDQGVNNLYHFTSSSNVYNAFCCKPDNNEGYCQSGNVHYYDNEDQAFISICSEPSKGGTAEYQNVLTDDRNHQMFAFCPLINQKKCGIKSFFDQSSDMTLKAELDKQTLSTTDILYKKASSDSVDKAYDACYYEITSSAEALNTTDEMQLKLKIQRKLDVNIYIYGGQSRLNATESIIPDNDQASVNETYIVPAEEGFLVIAYPDETQDINQNTAISFQYWVEKKPEPPKPPEPEPINNQTNTTNTTTNATTAVTTDTYINDIGLLVLSFFGSGSGSANNLWANLGGLDKYIDFTGDISLGKTFVKGVVLEGFMTGKFKQQQMIYTVDIISLIMMLATAAYVVIKTVEAGISFTKGFYAEYAQASAFSNFMYLYELAIIACFQLWGFIITILSLLMADDIWKKTEARLEDAALFSTGLETALSWNKVIRVVTLLGMTTISVVTAGLSLGDVADELIGYIDNYDDKTSTEGDEKTDSSNKDAPGTSAQWDVGISHLITSFYSYFLFSAISYGGFIFYDSFEPLEDLVACDFYLARSDSYKNAGNILGSIRNYKTCMAVIDDIFELIDLNKDNIISRCEDANFQHRMGNYLSFSNKFSSQYTRPALRQLCSDIYPNQI